MNHPQPQHQPVSHPQGQHPYPGQASSEPRGHQALRELLRDAERHRDALTDQVSGLDQQIATEKADHERKVEELQADRASLAAVLKVAAETVSRYRQQCAGLPPQPAPQPTPPGLGGFQAPELAGDPDASLTRPRPSQARGALLPETRR
ncbi:hypothetical protein ACIBG7_43050 [Nonomuraea sp. NPDC050328]|uniref:hypothetical protein n=1 Tax=Nonomuraea sp. NPDC050328 TaxID=3364361 RepID=UPI0037B1991E